MYGNYGSGYWIGDRDVFERMEEISKELAIEQGKPDNERDKGKEFNLIYAEFMQGLKLSTGYYPFLR